MSNYTITNMSVSVDEIFSWDVTAVIAYVTAVVLVTPFSIPPSVRFVLVLPLLSFIPGYALSTVLFPGGSTPGIGDSLGHGRSVTHLDGVERAGLSVGLSLGLLPVFAFVFSVMIGTIMGPIVPALAGVVLLLSVVGGLRRARLPEHERFSVPLGRWVDEVRNATVDGPRREVVINIVLAGSILVAIGVLGIAFAMPQQGASFTEFSVGTTDGGEFVTSGYETDLALNQQAEFDLFFENNEGDMMNYVVVAQFERVDDGTVTEVDEAGTFSVLVEPGDSTIERRTVTPSMEGDDIRLTFLLFLDQPTGQPDRESAYRSVHVWVTVG